MKSEPHKLVPPQTRGFHKELKHDVLPETIDDANELFVAAKDRLLDVNNWKEVSTAISSEFHLADKDGHALDRPAQSHDYIRIKIPAPGTDAGDGYDWVHIEAIEYDDFPDEDYETFAMRVRPSANPLHTTEETAHFFDDAATSTFVIERRGRHITAHYYGRNEKANTDNGLKDNVRNIAVSVGAWLLGSDTQWLSLITGLIDPEPND